VLTRQGWILAVGAIVLGVGGRILGLVELIALAVVAAALLAGCLVLVRASRLELTVGRVLHPSRVHVGTPSRVELTVRNRRNRTTPVLRLRDEVSGTRGADLLVPPLNPDQRTVAAYRLPTDRRGLVQVGPLRVVVGDPFGLATLATVGAPAVQLTILPRVDDIEPLPRTTAPDPQAGARRMNAVGRHGDEFYALRPYVVGDDLRRVHWPSSARTDDLLVRQNEMPWQHRTTVLLDVRSSAHHGDSLELAVSVAASIVAATGRREDLIRLMTTAGYDSEYGTGLEHTQSILEHLAVVPASPGASLRRSVEALRDEGRGGAVVAVLAAVPDEEVALTNSLRTRFGSLTVVHLDRSAWDRDAPVGPATPALASTLRVSRDAPFRTAWNGYVRARRGRTPGVAALR
jgi:uncharacterized protein (DUF58 family)